MNFFSPACGSGSISQYDFAIKHGTDFRRVFRFRDQSGVLIALDGYAVKFKAVNGTLVIDQTLALLLVGDPNYPGALLHLDPVATREIPLGRLTRYALEVWAPGSTPPGSGDQTVVLEGFLNGEEGNDNND